MKHTHLLILVCLLVLPATVAAQPNQVKKPETAKPAAKATPAAWFTKKAGTSPPLNKLGIVSGSMNKYSSA